MDNYNSDELEAPEWLNTSFLEDVLRQSENDKNVKVIDYTVSPATQKGDHFASIMFRIEIDYLVSDKPKNIPLILKTLPVVEGTKKELVSNSQAFETEIKMYSEIIPKFHKILRDIGDDTILGAKMIYSSLDPIKIIIFEDLKTQGYQMVPDKAIQPNEIDVILKKICRWHAISFKLIKEGDESVKSLKHGVFTLQNDGIIDFFNAGFEGFSNLLKEEDIDPIYLEKFEKLRGTLYDKCRDMYKFQGDMCVLNHGDFHINNVMVKLAPNGQIDDLMLVDFQFCIAAPISIDLIYFPYSMLNPECREKRDEILYKYYTLFVEILNKLGYKGKLPTLIDIRREMMQYKELELIMAIAFLPFMFAIKENAGVDDKVMEEPELFKKYYKIPQYINLVKKMLPEFLYQGYLD